MMKLSHLFNLPAYSLQDLRGVLEDVIIDVEAEAITWWRVDLGQGRGHAPVMVAARAGRLHRDRLLLTADPKALTEVRDRSLAGHVDPIDQSALPDLMTGPFGNTVSPSLAMTLFNAWRKSRQRQLRPVPDFAGSGAVWASDLTGRKVFNARGPMGRLRDIHVHADGSLSTLEISKTARGRPRLISARRLRHLPKGGRHLVVA